jgi:hypothetical protein
MKIHQRKLEKIATSHSQLAGPTVAKAISKELKKYHSDRLK